jgi:hypothetical protein
MNLNYGRLNGYVLPDPWDREGQPHPERLAPFYRTVARQVQESSREGPLSKKEMLAFGWFLVRNGLRPDTAGVLLKQLWRERRDPGLRWRRAMLLDRLQYDVFCSLNRRFHLLLQQHGSLPALSLAQHGAGALRGAAIGDGPPVAKHRHSRGLPGHGPAHRPHAPGLPG